MLARRKRDNKLDPTRSEITKFKSQLRNNNNKKQTIATNQHPTTNIIKDQRPLIIRSKRSQADDRWPISYKGDSQKKSYSKRDYSQQGTLKRGKRVTLDREEDEDFAKLFETLEGKSDNEKKKRDLTTTQARSANKKTLVKFKIVDGKLEEILHRSKRTEDV